MLQPQVPQNLSKTEKNDLLFILNKIGVQPSVLEILKKSPVEKNGVLAKILFLVTLSNPLLFEQFKPTWVQIFKKFLAPEDHYLLDKLQKHPDNRPAPLAIEAKPQGQQKGVG